MGIVNARFLQTRPIVLIEVSGRWDDVMNWAADYKSTFSNESVNILDAHESSGDIVVLLERKRRASTPVS